MKSILTTGFLETFSKRIKALFSETTAPYSLAFFRVIFGLLMTWAVISSLLRQTVYQTLTAPRLRFSYPMTEWLEPLPGRGMEVLWIGMALACIGITLGLAYRVSISFFTLGYTYSFFLDAANYTNADYLVVLLSFLLLFSPAHAAYSLDNQIRGRSPRGVLKIWPIIFAFQFATLYLFAGVAKIHDDWLAGGPLTIILASRSDFPILGALFEMTYTGLILSWFSLLFDLSVIFLVMWRRTRILAFIMAFGFHGTNSLLFDIGFFPWLSIAGLTLFLPSDWPEKTLRRKRTVELEAPKERSLRAKKTAMSLVGVYVVFQIVLPLRHFVIGENYTFDDTGNTFAWHMISAHKEGETLFRVKDASGEVLYEGPGYDLNILQRKNLVGRPDSIRQYAHYLAEEEKEKNGLSYLPKVYVEATVSLNGREPQYLIDPTVDMSDRPSYLFTPFYVKDLEGEMPPRKKLIELGLSYTS